jgi:23S rRNA (pseudouridine1915-N3)-methyltransferase
VKIVVRAVGKLRDRRMEELCREYLDRVRRHLPVEVVEVTEDAELTRGLPVGSEVVALEPGGAAWTTDDLMKFISERMVRGTRALVFLIGGAEGLSAATVAQAGRRLSLTPLTWPHRLARVILCEQIYRCVSAIRGEPYNK